MFDALSHESIEVCRNLRFQVASEPGVLAALYKVNHKYLRVKSPMPTTITPIEACAINCMNAAVAKHATFPKMSDGFERRTRLSMADKHQSNDGSDFIYASKEPGIPLHKFHCQAQGEAKIADNPCAIFVDGKRGLLNTCLACSL